MACSNCRASGPPPDGRTHPVLHPAGSLPDDYELVVVADPDVSRVEFVRSFTEAQGASTLEDVLARDDVDVVSLGRSARTWRRTGDDHHGPNR